LVFARLVGLCERTRGQIEVEVTVKADRPDLLAADAPALTSKRIRLNKSVRRAIDLIGQINVVMFTPEDIELVSGSPLLRRRYIDVTISQIDTQYCRTLGHYNKVLVQRNHLLRHIRDRRTRPEQTEFWDEEVIKAGTFLTVQRRRAVEELNELAEGYHRQLTGTGERLAVLYKPSVDLERHQADAVNLMADPSATVGRAFREQMRQNRPRELAQGVSLVGPHRDDLQFLIDGMNVNLFGSRGQQRTVSLSLKLAESDYLRRHAGEEPILLLDDALSELDEARRNFVAATVKKGQQVILTGTDLSAFPTRFLGDAQILRVENGAVAPLDHARAKRDH
jgi:DNA replication and repair protein RecF